MPEKLTKIFDQVHFFSHFFSLKGRNKHFDSGNSAMTNNNRYNSRIENKIICVLAEKKK